MSTPPPAVITTVDAQLPLRGYEVRLRGMPLGGGQVPDGGLLAEATETYYLTDHYRNYPVVLVRLSRVPIDELRVLLGAAWRFVSARKSRAASRPR